MPLGAWKKGRVTASFVKMLKRLLAIGLWKPYFPLFKINRKSKVTGETLRILITPKVFEELLDFIPSERRYCAEIPMQNGIENIVLPVDDWKKKIMFYYKEV